MNTIDLSRSHHYLVRAAFASVNKADLADLIVLLLREKAGDEGLDGSPLVEAFARVLAPLHKLREDKPRRYLGRYKCELCNTPVRVYDEIPERVLCAHDARRERDA